MVWVILDYYIQQNKMRLSNYVDPTRCWQLLSGVLGIYFSYLVTGIVHESMYAVFKKGSRSNTRMITPVKRRTSLGRPDFWYSPVGRPGLSALSSTISKSNRKIARTFPVKTQLFAQLPLPSQHWPILTLSTSLTSQWSWCSNLVTSSRSSWSECFAQE